jgi:hypothetical protein
VALAEPTPKTFGARRQVATSARMFAATLFLSAGLLFFVQPMVAKLILPTFGGAAAVWTTCLVFFQVALLTGYAYAHVVATRLSARKQAVLHAGVVTLPLLALPIVVPAGWSTPDAANPVARLLGILAVAVGLPFFVVATSAPLLQRWFAAARHARSHDPYFLYAASNAGSLLALLAYPFVVEPLLPLRRQSMVWAAGYGVLVLLTWACAVAVWRHAAAGAEVCDKPVSPPQDAGTTPGRPTGIGSRLHWVVLAFVPSSLLLAVTTHLTTDIAPVPLLWVGPLAVYLLSYILAFSRLPWWFLPLVRSVLPLTVLAQIYLLVVIPPASLKVLIAANLFTLFAVSMSCHGELARRRPPAAHLTEFYFWASAGGALGGVFNALLAPLLFSWLVEYPLALVLACLLMAPLRPRPASRLTIALDLLLPLALGLLAAAALFRCPEKYWTLLFAVLALLAAALMTRPVRMGLGAAALLVVGLTLRQNLEPTVYRERNFYGIVRVVRLQDMHILLHGRTEHGAQQQRNDRRVRDLPRAYYYPTGPAGQVFAAFFNTTPKRRVAVVGLGAGALASYGEKGQVFTFFEIDPAVIALASDRRYFTYLCDSDAQIRVVPGDARLSLAREPDRSFDLLILDAFSGDSIPTHLLTREALGLYLNKLTPDGTLLMHISNNYLELGPVVSRLAASHDLVALAQYDEPTPREASFRKLASYWAVVARREEHLGSLARDQRWRPLALLPDTPLWTDDYSNVFRAVKRR